jgi:lantibiotic transport system permease protein
MSALVRSFQSEWLKTKRSLAAWLVVCGAFFTPTIITAAKLMKPERLATDNASPTFWQHHWQSSWESMAIFLLPLGVILATSLITQLEYKNNSWKLLHTTPQRYWVIFLAKLAVILLMMGQFLALFNVGIYLSGVLPGVLFGVPYPPAPIPYATFLAEDGRYFIACLPIVALQYLISLRFKHFMVPLGCGLALWIGSVAAVNWSYGYLIPYTYCLLHFLKHRFIQLQALELMPFALGYFLFFTAAAYGLYAHQREKG